LCDQAKLTDLITPIATVEKVGANRCDKCANIINLKPLLPLMSNKVVCDGCSARVEIRPFVLANCRQCETSGARFELRPYCNRCRQVLPLD
jgi:hypothetical protein